jgi:putative nucleotide binding protein
MREDYIIVLDFLPTGHPGSRRVEPTAQGIGTKFFNLLEVIIKPEETVKPGDVVYVGDGKWDKVRLIKGRIKYNELTSFAKQELEFALDKLIDENEKRFVEFFNKAGPLTTRLHSLELLQGIGKKHMWAILQARKEKPFENFEDLRKRVEMLPDPKKMIKKRIIDELNEVDRHKLFVF